MTALKTLSLRIRGYDEETEELSDDVIEATGKVADLTKVASNNYAGVSLWADAEQTKYRSLKDYLGDISKIWDEIDAKSQTDLLNNLFGKRGASVGSAILQNFDQVEKAIEQMDEAAGSSDREMSIIRDSISYKLNALSQTWVQTLTSIADRGGIGKAIDGLTDISEWLGTIISDLGLVKTALIAVGTVIGTRILSKTNSESLSQFFHGNDAINNKDNIKFLENIQSKLDVGIKIDDDAIEDAKKGLSGLTDEATAFANKIKQTNGEILGSKKAVDVFTSTFKSGLRQVGSMVVDLGKSLVKNILKGGLALIASYAATQFISLLGKGLNTLRVLIFGHTKKELEEIKKKIREAAEVAKSEFKSISDDFNTHSKTVEDVKKRYAELAQGVKDLGLATQSQGSLSNDDYSEFLDISKQLVEVFPTLNAGYSDSGDVLTTLNGDVNTITSSLTALLEVEKQLAYQNLNEKMPDIWAGYGTNVNDASGEYNKLRERIDILNYSNDLYYELLDAYKQNLAENGVQNGYKTWGDYLTDLDISDPDVSDAFVEIFEANGIEKFDLWQKPFDIFEDSFDEYFKTVILKYEKDADLLKKTVDRENSQIENQILALLQFDYDYYTLSGDDKNIVNAILQNIGYDTDYHKQRKEGDWKGVYNDVKRRTIGFVEGLSTEDKSTLATAQKNAREFSKGEQTVAQYKQYAQQVKDILEKNGASEDVANALLPDEETIENGLEHVKSLMGENWSDDLENEFDAQDLKLAAEITLEGDPYSLDQLKEEIENKINPVKVEPEIQSTDFVDAINEAKTAITSLEDLWNQAFGEGNLKIADKLEELSEGGTVDLTLRPEIDTSELKAAGWDADGGYATVLTSTYGDETETKFLNFTPIIVDPVTGEYKGVLTPEELDAYANDVINGVRTDDLNLQIGAEFSSITEAEKAAELIHNLHAAKHDGQDLYTDYDIIDIDKIEAVEKAFGGIGEKDSKVSLALANFEDTLVKFPGNAQKTKDAINELVTAYIDQTEVIQNLDESNAEMARRQLRDMGITNAEEVVQSRLSKQVKATQKAIAALAKQLVSYNETLNNTASTEDDIKNAQKELAKSVKEALKMYDAEGNPLEHVFEFSEGFIEKHSEDINAMAAGDMEALDRVRLAAARGAVMEVTVGVPTEAAEQNINALMDMVAQADAKNIDIGASIDDSAFIDTLNNMMKAGIFTADQVSAAFESMGYEAVFRDNSYPVDLISMVTKKGANGMPTTVMEEMKNAGKVSFPSLEIIRKKGSSRGGAGAKYSAPSSSSTTSDNGSGGGGGGGGSEPTQPKDDTEETFDWIEVAIQRIEEEMARLDKIVGNSYIKWSDRNSALTDEINKTTEAIKAQELAEEEYYRNANELQVNDGKGLNDDDYGENDYLVKEHDQKLLDEARSIWATGEYQEKVKHGLLTGDDIERIDNKYLIETIKLYQEL